MVRYRDINGAVLTLVGTMNSCPVCFEWLSADRTVVCLGCWTRAHCRCCRAITQGIWKCRNCDRWD